MKTRVSDLPPRNTPPSWGTLMATVLILLLIIIAALYVWGERISKEGGVAPSEILVVQ